MIFEYDLALKTFFCSYLFTVNGCLQEKCILKKKPKKYQMKIVSIFHSNGHEIYFK